MNRKVLQKKLDELSISRSSYNLYGGDASQKITIEKKRGKWIYNFIDERGNLFQRYFQKEDDVCEHIYQEFIRTNEINSGIIQPESTRLSYKVTKKGTFIVFENGMPKWKNGVEICPENPIILNGKPVLFDEDDVFDENEIFHDF
jgi:hypothetical protein